MNKVAISEPEQRLKKIADSLLKIDHLVPELQSYGKVQRVVGGLVKAFVPNAVLGELCKLINPDGSETLSEVVAFEEDGALLSPYSDLSGIGAATKVIGTGSAHRISVGPEMLGHVFNGLGIAIDHFNMTNLGAGSECIVKADPPNPMTRKSIEQPMSFGVKAMDGLLTCGEGQRLGIFAAAGGGKSTLLGMIVKHTNAEVVVIGLIGERGREVREFIEDELGEAGLKKSIIVVATSDRPAAERVKAAHVATTIAEYFRDEGTRVLLLMDSVTRFARAQREIGLAAGEPPTRRGFPSSVFAELPRLLERAGNNHKGSITALYTVLVEGDDPTEPVADETRSILDGHIMLSRKLASANHYPAIDVLNSVSRVMGKIASSEHIRAAGRLRELMAKYEEVELLIRVGEFKSGADSLADEAVSRIDEINKYLKQGVNEACDYDSAIAGLIEVVGVKSN